MYAANFRPVPTEQGPFESHSAAAVACPPTVGRYGGQGVHPFDPSTNSGFSTSSGQVAQGEKQQEIKSPD